ncbi:hypothetical protein MIND_00656000 [Mycena indigotica]|uniref:Peptidase A1 domain-containing protein n=1 Tax=Mycena indigotica TaxID=2126181 RepID=A0A8H6W2X8_9AGAR|nr:uncharacterized protein MIND_00656000 [Mycena indigotica]KAF7300931.1 hypothetical protein MIND_00656000 [Mycena indigotica]
MAQPKLDGFWLKILYAHSNMTTVAEEIKYARLRVAANYGLAPLEEQSDSESLVADSDSADAHALGSSSLELPVDERILPEPQYRRPPYTFQLNPMGIGHRTGLGDDIAASPSAVMTFGREDGISPEQRLRFLVDLGSNAFWAASAEITGSDDQYLPFRGRFGAFHDLWGYRNPRNRETVISTMTDEFCSGCADGKEGQAVYRLHRDRIYFKHADDWSKAETLPVVFGVAHDVSEGRLQTIPADGILPLGRRMSFDPNEGYSFLGQIAPHLEHPELTMYFTKTGNPTGAILLGKCTKVAHEKAGLFGPWHDDIPLIGDLHWALEANLKKVDDEVHQTNTRLAQNGIVFDSDSTFTFLEDLLFHKIYKEHRLEYDPAVEAWTISADTISGVPLPSVEIQLGPATQGDSRYFPFPVLYLRPAGAAAPPAGPGRVVCAIQPLSQLSTDEGAPEVLGITALTHLAVKLRFPDVADRRCDRLAWRTKPADCGALAPRGAWE